MTEHLLKTPEERKQPYRSTSASTSASASASARGSSLALSADKPPLGVSGAATKKSRRGSAKWAVTELLDVSDFDALVPRPAHRFPFTLDGFQKQAVARLEVCVRVCVGLSSCTRQACSFLFSSTALLPRFWVIL